MSHPTNRAERMVQRKEVNLVLLRSKGGAHGKSTKAKRQQEKREWKQAVSKSF